MDINRSPIGLPYGIACLYHLSEIIGQMARVGVSGSPRLLVPRVRLFSKDGIRRHANQSQPVRPRAQHIISIKSDFIKKSDVAKIGSVSIRTVENWTKNGLLPYLKIKGIVRYRRKDVEDALDAFIVNPRTRKREPKN